MRTEWATGSSRVRRWSEEVELLQEEMVCAIAFFSWKEGWWLSRVGKHDDVDQTLPWGLMHMLTTKVPSTSGLLACVLPAGVQFCLQTHSKTHGATSLSMYIKLLLPMSLY
jgi:hypothetical protein